MSKINNYLRDNESKIRAFVEGDYSALWDDNFIREKILDIYKSAKFGGFNYAQLVDILSLPEQVTDNQLKQVIGKLIADGELEYVDYYCYRVYPRFIDYYKDCLKIGERSKGIIEKRLSGYTLESIAQDYNMTRERIRQILVKEIPKIQQVYYEDTGLLLFEEDYYKHLYETYDFDKKDGSQWFAIPQYVWTYLDLCGSKRGHKNLKKAIDDTELDVGLRLKIKNYLNRNMLYYDGMWVEKNRVDLEKLVVKYFCLEDTTFDEFVKKYNEFLISEDIPYSENIYCTEEVYRTRKNHLLKAQFLLWKQNETLRYYDIEGRDFTELLDTLNLESYKNIEISTMKLVRDNPEILDKYDIRDQYDLHNLLRKIIPEGSYNNFQCGRTPMIKFGDFDRNEAIKNILIDNAPIRVENLLEIISDEFGYNPAVIQANYLSPFSAYLHNGTYSLPKKIMSAENMQLLKTALTEDFYYFDDIRKIYASILPAADIEEINPYNLKMMGFLVYSSYVIQNYESCEAYFNHILTEDDIVDITKYKKQFVYINAYSSIFVGLKRDMQIIEFEPNQIINFRKLEQSGITKDMIFDYCDDVYDFVDDGEYFSSQTLKQDGFESDLYELGFSDWFYANLLFSDSRFSFGNMFNNIILYKGKQNITIKSFIIALIKKHGVVDTLDLINEISERFGCKIKEKSNILYRIKDTEIYYDSILDKLYANKDLYYKEIEEGFLS